MSLLADKDEVDFEDAWRSFSIEAAVEHFNTDTSLEGEST